MANEKINVVKKKVNPFVMVEHELINNENLSWGAKGLLIYMLSKPDNWKFYKSDVVKHATNGIDSVNNILKELEENDIQIKIEE